MSAANLIAVECLDTLPVDLNCFSLECSKRIIAGISSKLMNVSMFHRLLICNVRSFVPCIPFFFSLYIVYFILSTLDSK